MSLLDVFLAYGIARSVMANGRSSRRSNEGRSIERGVRIGTEEDFRADEKRFAEDEARIEREEQRQSAQRASHGG